MISNQLVQSYNVASSIMRCWKETGRRVHHPFVVCWTPKHNFVLCSLDITLIFVSGLSSLLCAANIREKRNKTAFIFLISLQKTDLFSEKLFIGSMKARTHMFTNCKDQENTFRSQRSSSISCVER